MKARDYYQNEPQSTFIVATICGKPYANYSFPFRLTDKQIDKEVNDIMDGLARDTIVVFEITRRNSFTEYTKTLTKVS